MHIHWHRKTLTSNRQNGEISCPHAGVKNPVILTPVLRVYKKKTAVVSRRKGKRAPPKYREVWRPGPGIRECCLLNPPVQAAWWWEVRQRFKDLAEDGIEDDPDLSGSLVHEQNLIESLLATVVQFPSLRELRKYEANRSDFPRRVKRRVPGFVAVLDIPWPCTEEQLRGVWKKLALKHHPDRGGDQSEFIRVKTAYERAVAKLSANGTVK